MEITSIKECGANNILLWAIANGADIRNELELQQLINDETYYSITLSNVNFIELFRLSQVYRDKVRVISENRAGTPMRKDTAAMFPGTIKDEDKETPCYELAEKSCDDMIALALRMNADDDIIQPATSRLYLPMLSRSFDIQIPVNFTDLINAMPANYDTSILFNKDYPNNLSIFIEDEKFELSRKQILLALVRSLTIVRYTQKMDELVSRIKYGPLKKVKSDSLVSFKMVGFKKYDPVSRNEVHCSLFNPNKANVSAIMKRLSRINTPLQVEFVVQMPIQYMCDICNTYSVEDIGISYESSMADIIGNELPIAPFNTVSVDEGSDDAQLILDKYNNAVDEYKNQITEVIKTAIGTIAVLNDTNTCDELSTFALLPTIYKTKAIFTIAIDKFDKLLSFYNAAPAEMFSSMLAQANSLNAEISNS